MVFSSFLQRLKWGSERFRAGAVRRQKPRRRVVASRRSFVPRLGVLEDRTLLSTFTVTNLLDSGPGSLRQAVLDANTQPGADTIRFAPAARDGTIALTSGQLNITDDLTIDGPGANRLAVSGTDTSRVFRIDSGRTVDIDGLTITRGRADNGGGIWNAGGTLSLSHVVVSQNEALGAPGSRALGGGVFNQGGTLTVTHSTFTDNQVTGGPGATGGDGNGGGIASVGSGLGRAILNLSHSLLHGNRAVGGVGGTVPGGDTANGRGGGIYLEGPAESTVTHSTVSENQAIGGQGGTGRNGGPGRGGGIQNNILAAADAATLTVSHSRVTGNQAIGGAGGQGGNGGVGQGGGIRSLGPAGVLTITIVSHSEVTGNQAIGGAGGAGGNGGIGSGGGIIAGINSTLTVSHTTLADNRAIGGAGGTGGNGGVGRGGGLFVNAGTVTLEHVRITGNQAIGGAGESRGQGVGGGIYILAGTVCVKKTKIKHNFASTSHDDVFGVLDEYC